MCNNTHKKINLITTIQYQKCSLDLYVDFLISSQTQFSGVELSKVAPNEMAHDSVSRWLSQRKLTPKMLWHYVESKEIIFCALS